MNWQLLETTLDHLRFRDLENNFLLQHQLWNWTISQKLHMQWRTHTSPRQESTFHYCSPRHSWASKQLKKAIGHHWPIFSLCCQENQSWRVALHYLCDLWAVETEELCMNIQKSWSMSGLWVFCQFLVKNGPMMTYCFLELFACSTVARTAVVESRFLSWRCMCPSLHVEFLWYSPISQLMLEEEVVF